MNFKWEKINIIIIVGVNGSEMSSSSSSVVFINNDVKILFNSRMIFIRKKMYTWPKKSNNDDGLSDGLVSVTEFSELPWWDCGALSLTEVSQTELRIQFGQEVSDDDEDEDVDNNNNNYSNTVIKKITMHHPPAYQNWIAKIHVQRLWSALERANLKRFHKIRTAIAMSLHPRLGKNSPLSTSLNLDALFYLITHHIYF